MHESTLIWTLLLLNATTAVIALRRRVLPYSILSAVFIWIWAGSAAVPSYSLPLLMCIVMVIPGITINQFCLMGATSRMKKQAPSSSLASAVNSTLSIYWVRSMGTFGVLLATVKSYALFILAAQAWEVRSILLSSGPEISLEGAR